MERPSSRRFAAGAPAAILIAVVLAGSAAALPRLRTVADGLERFRSATGDVSGAGRLTWGEYRGVAVRLDRPWNEPPRLVVGGTTLRADWTDTTLDPAVRLAGAALSAGDLADALQSLGRSLEPEVQTLALVGDHVAYVVGGPLDVPTPRLYVDRETYALLAIELPLPDGLYRVELSDYSLVNGWFPRRLEVLRDDRPVLELVIDEIE